MPHAGDPVPTFTAARVNGSGTVDVSATGGVFRTADRAAVLRPLVPHLHAPSCPAWPPRCGPRTPPAGRSPASGCSGWTVRTRSRWPGPSSPHSGVTFPVAHDPNVAIISGNFYFEGDPYAVFVNSDGTIDKIVGSAISPAKFTAVREGAHSQRKLRAAAVGAATAHTASTTHDWVGTGEPVPRVACKRGGERLGRQELGHRSHPVGELGDGDDHAAEQQQHEIEPVGRGQVDLGLEHPGHEEPDAAEGGGGQQDGGDGGAAGRSPSRAGRGSSRGRSPRRSARRPGGARPPRRWRSWRRAGGAGPTAWPRGA